MICLCRTSAALCQAALILVQILLASCGGTEDAVRVHSALPASCSIYCDLMAINCTRGFVQYADYSACLTGCQTFEVTTNPNISTGNTLQCRMLYAASANRPERKQAFCTNAGPSGGDDCL